MVVERVAIGRSVGFKIIQNGETPLRPGPAFLTRYKKEEGEERDAEKLLTFLYDRAPGIAST